ncbi:MAG TPA: CoA pyrophosphatase [Bacteroidales bacterium]|nr:CoA pyrophosphatase [Bacteroidales bacterium]
MDHSSFILNLRERLNEALPGEAAQLKMAPSYRHMFPLNDKEGNAGVMILLYPVSGELTTVFMKRTEYPGVHSGQISFPGGRFEPEDSDLQTTALRETEEEFGIAARNIEVLGKLTPLYIPVSRMEVHPFVGYLAERPMFSPDPREVERLIEIKIADLLQTSIVKTKPQNYKDYKGFAPYFEVHENHVWGATAMILSEFLEIIR